MRLLPTRYGPQLPAQYSQALTNRELEDIWDAIRDRSRNEDEIVEALAKVAETVKELTECVAVLSSRLDDIEGDLYGNE